MSQQQYNNIMSTMLKEKHALTKLRSKLEGRKGKLCRCCKKFGHLARNCRNGKERGKETIVPQNKFEVLKARVMQCRAEEENDQEARDDSSRMFQVRREGAQV